MDNSPDKHEWLLLIHQIPPKPGYFRVKIWRRLQQIGAVAVKQSVYVMPKNPPAHEDLSWTLKEIIEGGGDASLCEARFLEGLTDEQIVSMFQGRHVRPISRKSSRKPGPCRRKSTPNPLIRPRRWPGSNLNLPGCTVGSTRCLRLIFFRPPNGPSPRWSWKTWVRCSKARPTLNHRPAARTKELKGRTWVTRDNVFVDRIACAWLIRRFVDPGAEFKFMPFQEIHAATRRDPLRHVRGRVHARRRHVFLRGHGRAPGPGPADAGPLAEIVHDIDLKDDKFGRPEAAGVKALVDGPCGRPPGGYRPHRARGRDVR